MDIKQFKLDYKNNTPISVLMDIYGISKSTLYRHVKSHGLERSIKVDYRCVCNDHINGMSVLAISKKYRCSRNKIKSILSSNGVEINTKYRNVITLDIDSLHGDKSVNNIIDTHGVSKYTAIKLRNVNGIVGNTNHLNLPRVEILEKHLKDSRSALDLSREYKCHYQSIINILGDDFNKSFKSGVEVVIKNLLDSNEIEYIQNKRSIIPPLELDFYLPDYNLAIEVNGVYWHTENHGNKNKQYHLNKTTKCFDIGIELLHFWDIEILNNYNTIESMVLSRCNKSSRLYARKCIIKVVDSMDSKAFLDENHLQGACSSSINYGLYYNNELVSLMTFGKARFSKKVDWELIRFCNKLGFSVVGGASKLLKHFTRNNNGSIVSYANKRWSNGNLYKQLGFTYSHTSSPNYFYTKDYKLLESRNKYQKHKLSKVLADFDENHTEWSNMMNNGYDRVWDCGNQVWILN